MIYTYFKKNFCLIFSLLFCGKNLICQVEPSKLFVGLGYYRHTGLIENSYADLKVGTELFSYKFISPEIDFSYYLGATENTIERNADTQLPTANLKKNFEGFIWGMAPKLFWGDNEFRIVVIPKYSFGKIVSKSFLSNISNQRIEQRVEARINFWSFSIGLEGEIGNERLNIGIYLAYIGFDAGKVLNKINLVQSSISNINTETLGLQLRIAYSLWE